MLDIHDWGQKGDIFLILLRSMAERDEDEDDWLMMGNKVLVSLRSSGHDCWAESIVFLYLFIYLYLYLPTASHLYLCVTLV